ncbi:MAG: iron-containing alcohol dehydrogenase [Bacteroidales bacterium]|nr:iron-containing alcohol dehydrogenase [Bacteroidales bacterium]
MKSFDKARALLEEFKGGNYLFGNDVLSDVGAIAAQVGTKVAFVYTDFPSSEDYIQTIKNSLAQAGIKHLVEIEGARPNAPLEDLDRITKELIAADPDVLVSFGGGSTIDAAKAAEVLRTLGGKIEDYFGVGLVTKKVEETGKTLTPHVAIQTAASSAAHLTKYSNITDVSTGQKKLIVDEAIVPAYPVFDYTVTHKAPPPLTLDGALDGIAHILEVFYGAVGKDYYDQLYTLAETGIGLVVNYLAKLTTNPEDMEAREAICLATDLGGYAIMIGGTNGGHLTSFSLVDVLTHGRACAMMNPYYSVFFAPAVQGPLELVGQLLKDGGYITDDISTLQGRALGEVVANGFFDFAKAVNFPTTLGEVPGFTDGHIERALTAAKNPQLKMKLENMPIPLTAEMIDEYMGPILQAGKSGDLALIKNV